MLTIGVSGKRNLMSELEDIVGVERHEDDESVKKELNKIRIQLMNVTKALIELGYFEVTRLPMRQAIETLHKSVGEFHGKAG